MISRSAISLLFFVFIAKLLVGQDTGDYSWWNPATNAFPVVEGQAWHGTVKDFYDRLPAKAETVVRKEVWNLSRHSAGLYIKFNSNAKHIIVRYTTTKKGNYAMPHMPATGVSGVDLYALDHSGNWVWAPGKYAFGDTVTYQFMNMEVDTVFRNRDCEFRLFLPLYNGVSWMEIGVPKENTFQPLPLTKEKPVVFYGTSILQGGCASRPGLGWTSIVERRLDCPVINLGFSGNGRLEPEIIDLINEIDAKLYVLDCIPNMVHGGQFSDDELASRISKSVNSIRQKHPGIPILLVAHSLNRFSGMIEASRYTNSEISDAVLTRIYDSLKKSGMKELYLLDSKAIGFDIDATVDGVHPNDIGMKYYADACTKIIRSILHEEEGAFSTMKPIIQTRDGYDWRGRHEAIKALNMTDPPQNIFIGNSIIHYWGGKPEAARASGKASWEKYLEPPGVRNMAYGWDRIENALWRVYHGELDGIHPKHIVIMLGTNNLQLNTDEEIIAGLGLLLDAIQLRQPKTAVLLSGIFPRRNMEPRIVKLNRQIAALATKKKALFVDPGKVLLASGGKINEALFSDGLHPNATGYEKLAPVLAGYLRN
jgi:hypothetical protein